MDNPDSPPLPRLSGYQTSRRSDYYLHHRKLFSDLEKASVQARGDLLDIGCGNKPYEKMFAGRLSSYTGCDVVQSSEHKVDIICPATALASPDASFDTVLCTQVLEHVADHQALLREAFRVLRPGGKLILSAPMYWHLHEIPYDFFRFTEFGLRHLLEGAGFQQIDIMPDGGKWALCGQVLIHCLKGTVFERMLVTYGINRIFAYLDDKYPERSNPLNYTVVAGKP